MPHVCQSFQPPSLYHVVLAAAGPPGVLVTEIISQRNRGADLQDLWMPAPPPPNFNVDSKFLMDLCWVTSAEIISQMSEQSAANIEIGGGRGRHGMRSHT